MDAISALSETAGLDTGAFARVLREKHQKGRLSIDELNTIFEDYYTATEKLGRIIDEIKV